MGLQNVVLGAPCPGSLQIIANESLSVYKIHDLLEIVKVMLCSSSCFLTVSRLAERLDTGDNPLAAVKSYTKARLDAMAMRQVELEIQLHQQLQHNEHVVPFWLAAEDASQLHIVTQYCGEGDLRHKMKSAGSLAEAAVRDQVVRPLLCALSDMHKRGYVHRDVKPENCFLFQDRLLLGDFGLAIQLAVPDSRQQQQQQLAQISGAGAAVERRSRMSHDSSSSGGSDATCELATSSNGGSSSGNRSQLRQWHSMSSMAASPCSTPRQQAGGTPAYTAPEVVAAAFNNTSLAAALGPLNDVWSLGVLVMECLCGHHPFLDHCANAGAVMCEILSSSRQPDMTQLAVSDACKDWLTAALAIDPAQRATAQELLQHPWMTTELPAAAPWQLAAAQAQQQNLGLQHSQEVQQQQLLRQMLVQRSCPEQLMGCTVGGEGLNVGLQEPAIMSSCRDELEAARLWDAGRPHQLPGIKACSFMKARDQPPLVSSASNTASTAAPAASAGATAFSSSSSASTCGCGGDAAAVAAASAAAGLQRNALSCMGQTVGSGKAASGSAAECWTTGREQQQPAQRSAFSFLDSIGSWED